MASLFSDAVNMSVTVGHSLEEAIREFQGVLTPDQKQQLQVIKVIPDAAAVITFSAQLDRENAQRRTGGVATRLYTLLQSVQQFSNIVDTFVSSNPKIAALMWGSVKLTMLVNYPAQFYWIPHQMTNYEFRSYATSPHTLTSFRPYS